SPPFARAALMAFSVSPGIEIPFHELHILGLPTSIRVDRDLLASTGEAGGKQKVSTQRVISHNAAYKIKCRFHRCLQHLALETAELLAGRQMPVTSCARR